MSMSKSVAEDDSLLFPSFLVASLLSSAIECRSGKRVLMGELGWLMLPLAILSLCYAAT